MKAGLMAETETPDALIAVLRGLRALGYRGLDAFTPYVVPELEDVLDLKRSRITWIVGSVAFTAAGAAYFVQWLGDAHWYPLNTGGRPPHAVPAFMISTFVGAVLAGYLAGLFALLLFSRLPWLSNPVFDAEGFERASIDRFWLAVDSADPRFDLERTTSDLQCLGAQNVQWVGARAP